ncbi:MAG: hypothetical protein ACRERV_06110 [Methylococcales bacterium]
MKKFLDICLFRLGPQDLPASAFLFGLVLCLNGIVGLVILSIEAPLLTAIAEFLVSLGLLVGFIWILLALDGKTLRFQQTLTALLGTDIVISLAALPFLIWISFDHHFTAATYLLVASMIWNVAVVGHIIRHALSSPYLFGLGLSFLYFLGSFIVMNFLFSAGR